MQYAFEALGVRAISAKNVSYVGHEGQDPAHIYVNVPDGIQARVWVEQGALRIEGPSPFAGGNNFQVGLIVGDVDLDTLGMVQAGTISGSVRIGTRRGWLWRLWRFFFGRNNTPPNYITVITPAGCRYDRHNHFG